jgi:hypothetical protein
VLADQRSTRTQLMQLCLETRTHLGLQAGTMPQGKELDAAPSNGEETALPENAATPEPRV